jgi:hypothetical protein
MSEINGDKARFHRERKKKIAKRQRTRQLLRLVEQESESRSTPKARWAKS